ncbi:MAG: extracellular solute-binding protein [Treponema sp.]|jgi:raffinose/stachyose/melibiose transport system substrate-binding protein|nr:extracellular solute-binding protein [Treponema sp.]
MKRGKVFFLIVLSTGIVLALGGCRKGEEKSSAGGAIELNALQQLDNSTPYYPEDSKQVWEPFEKANPDIRVVREDLYNDGYHNKVEAYAAANQLPDIISVFPAGRSSTLHSQRLLKDLGPFIEQDGLRASYSPATFDPNNQLSGYVAMISEGLLITHIFVINNEVLRDCGLTPAKTYAELKAQVPILKAKGYDTILMGNQDTWVNQSTLFSMVAGRFCGERWEQNIHAGTAKFTDPDFVAALNFIKAMYDDGVLNRNVLTTDYGSVVGQFANNRGAYFIDGDWRASAFVTDPSTGEALISPDRQTNNFQITVFPDIPGAKLNRSTSGQLSMGWAMSAAIPSGSPKEAAAWKAIKWLTGKEVQTVMLKLGRISAPTRIDVDTGSIDVEPLLKQIMNLSSQYDTMTGVIDNIFHADVWTPINDGLEEIGIGSRTPEQVAQTVQNAFDAWKATQ